MATGILPDNLLDDDSPPIQSRTRPKSAARARLESILAPIASLKLTVALFSLAIFLVFAGTLAQATHDVWWVLHNYFRSLYVWIDFQVFFPPAWFPSWQHKIGGGFYFPGGFSIGSLMAANLLAAHGLRFKVQSGGPRLLWGLATIAAGCLITWFVIAAGPGKDGVQAATPIHWKLLWRLFLVGMGAGCVGIAAAIVFMDPKRKVERVVLGIVGSGLMILLAYLLFKIDVDAMTSGSMQSAVRVLWQVIEAAIAALVLLAGCIMVFRKRAGIVLLHAGIGLIMANELVVHFLHKETLMQITEGQTTNFASDIRTCELAVADTSSSKDQDNVVVVPEPALTKSVETGEPISDSKLPFNARVTQLFENSELTVREPGAEGPSNVGIGRALEAVAERPVTGADNGEKSNLPSAYVELTDKQSGQSLGTWLLSTHFGPQQIKVGDKTYDVSLRFERVYKPYDVHLYEVRRDNYLGTDVPRNYSSDFQLTDAARGVDRRVAIRMNEPFRYGGETFYQSGNPMPGVTVLTIVSNFGWMIPYVACMIVATGMLYHFSLTLVRFLYRREEGRIVSAPPKLPRVSQRDAPRRSRWQTVLPLAIALCAAGFLVWSALPPSYDRNEVDYYSFGRLPVEAGGRLQPIDTLARNSLRMLSLRDVYRDENGGLGIGLINKDGEAVISRVDPGSTAEAAGILPGDRIVQVEKEPTAGLKAVAVHDLLEMVDGLSMNLKVSSGNQPPREIKISRGTRPAVRWLLEMASRPDVAENLCVFRVDSLDLLGMLGLQRRPTYRYSWKEINARRGELEKAVKDAKTRSDASATVFDKRLAEFTKRMSLYDLLAASFVSHPLPPLPTEAERQADPEAAEKIDLQVKDRLLELPSFYERLSDEHPPLAVPPVPQKESMPDAKPGDWLPYSIAAMIKYVQDIRHDPANPATASWQAVFDAYAEPNARDFNRAVRNYSESLVDDPPAELSTANPTFEAWFNNWSPFFECQWLYFVAFCIAALAWLGWSGPLNRIAFWLIAVTFVAHLVALGFRMQIAGRPPITNLYSVAVYIGCGAVLAGLVLEYIYRLGFGNVLAAIAGFSSLLIADRLSLILDNTRGDTIGVQQAVLDTQFWLATHVTCEVTGYTATYVAGLLGLIYVIRGLFTPTLTKDEGKNLVRMIYGTLCFAIFFSFVGTVLGGLWADDSWGRFWGWDPKENGALIIVLWNALVLHARWDGLVKDRGLAVLAIGGNIVTSWSHFGVNQLGVGLHSYGFTEGVLVALGLFCASQLVMIVFGVLPKRLWLSHRALTL